MPSFNSSTSSQCRKMSVSKLHNENASLRQIVLQVFQLSGKKTRVRFAYNNCQTRNYGMFGNNLVTLECVSLSEASSTLGPQGASAFISTSYVIVVNVVLFVLQDSQLT